jgi:hypothetical protein
MDINGPVHPESIRIEKFVCILYDELRIAVLNAWDLFLLLYVKQIQEWDFSFLLQPGYSVAAMDAGGRICRIPE